MDETADELLMKSGFQMVLHAGDARVMVRKALDLARTWDFEGARAQLEGADKELIAGHEVQTVVLQKECSGDPQGYNVLFCHGMDTLMTVKSEYELAFQLVGMMESVDARMKGAVA